MSENISLEQFSWPLLKWFYKVQRDLPWRRSRDPYAIWVSEIMLQQTRVETVIPYFERFMNRFPDVKALAEAPEEDVLKHWEGLGYYSRARNLQAAAQTVAERYDGVVPVDPERFGGLKGVGSYTRGAVLSIAYQVPEPAVDGNVMRVFARWFGLTDDIAEAKTKTKIEALVRPLIPVDQPGDFNQALMELGSQVCTPRSPDCGGCPVQSGCSAFAGSMQSELPVKKKAKPVRVEQRTVLVMTRQRPDGQIEVWARQRPAKGLLANLWEFPHELAGPDGGDPMNGLKGLSGIAEKELRKAMDKAELAVCFEGSHIFSHIRWDLQAYHYHLPAGVEPDVQGMWFGPVEREKYAFAQAFTVIWNALSDKLS